ncbi:MAG: tRNA (adenosine(37)-N6)-threonylcarbamoyltransferase complex ATPase subunit type 1 TsaE [Deltaproteobacteria bacterium]|nr:tRNA (adenosine(37)-N6)-threonylcarbamoyltransferase complex ATPase subunit type 1 TsaE [Deltaproteobacteria bacterium]
MAPVVTRSETETAEAGSRLARELHPKAPAFVRLHGALGAGKTAFARGFIRTWLELDGDAPPESVPSPTFNVARVYGARSQLAHLDLYRLKDLSELEQLGFEHYFFELRCCLVEWLEQIPEALALMPEHAVEVAFATGATESERTLELRSPGSRKTS